MKEVARFKFIQCIRYSALSELRFKRLSENKEMVREDDVLTKDIVFYEEVSDGK